MDNGKFKLLDLFSGIGGFSLGLERSGFFETVAFCEIEKFPQRVLKKHWPEVPIYDDVRELTGERLVRDGIRVDAICGGFPCQDISRANGVWGEMLGIRGERSGLFYEITRLIGDIEPRWVILENVTELLRNGMREVLTTFAALGYDAEWHSIPASRVGSIQNRDRVWIVAYPAKNRVQGLFEGFDLGEIGQGRSCRQENLPEVYANPFGGNGWPEPLIRRGNGRPANWVDRISACGNSLDPAIPELIGRAIGEYELNLATHPQ